MSAHLLPEQHSASNVLRTPSCCKMSVTFAVETTSFGKTLYDHSSRPRPTHIGSDCWHSRNMFANFLLSVAFERRTFAPHAGRGLKRLQH